MLETIIIAHRSLFRVVNSYIGNPAPLAMRNATLDARAVEGSANVRTGAAGCWLGDR